MIMVTSPINGPAQISNIKLDNIYLSGDTSFLKVKTVASLIINQVTVIDTGPESSDDVENILIDLTEISSSVNGAYQISNIVANQSQITLVSISNSNQVKTISQSIAISNILYTNGYYEFANDIISTGTITSSGQFYVSFTNLTFSDIVFVRNANLLNFKHQSPNEFLVKDMTVSNVTAAGVLIQAFDVFMTNRPVKVKFQNLLATGINSEFKSFIQLQTGADIQIVDSSFEYMSTLESGAVIKAGSSKAIANIYDSSFTNNTAVEAPVFVTEKESVVR